MRPTREGHGQHCYRSTVAHEEGTMDDLLELSGRTHQFTFPCAGSAAMCQSSSPTLIPLFFTRAVHPVVNLKWRCPELMNPSYCTVQPSLMSSTTSILCLNRGWKEVDRGGCRVSKCKQSGCRKDQGQATLSTVRAGTLPQALRAESRNVQCSGLQPAPVSSHVQVMLE